MSRSSHHHADGADPWRAARDFDDLCALGARFASGELDRFPGWLGRGLDDESDELRDALTRLNRAGFLTTASQPARAPYPDHDGVLREQRAFVCGFALPALAQRLSKARRVRVRAFHVAGSTPPTGGMRRRGRAVAVSLRGGVACTFAGHDAFADELTCFEDELAESALRALARCAWVSAWDPRFGRARALWDELTSLAEERG